MVSWSIGWHTHDVVNKEHQVIPLRYESFICIDLYYQYFCWILAFIIKIYVLPDLSSSPLVLSEGGEPRGVWLRTSGNHAKREHRVMPISDVHFIFHFIFQPPKLHLKYYFYNRTSYVHSRSTVWETWWSALSLRVRWEDRYHTGDCKMNMKPQPAAHQPTACSFFCILYLKRDNVH